MGKPPSKDLIRSKINLINALSKSIEKVFQLGYAYSITWFSAIPGVTQISPTYKITGSMPDTTYSFYSFYAMNSRSFIP
jgi:hypothetical protein